MSPTAARNPYDQDGLGQSHQPLVRVDLVDPVPPPPRTELVEETMESANTESLLTEIDHVAIAVRDLAAAIDFYRESFGAVVEHREVVDSDGVEEALLRVADSYVQLLTPTRDDSPVASYLERRGEGLHHVGYRVADCQAALDAYRAAGGRAIDEAPRPGSRGTTVAFLHPKTSFGTLIELVEE